ncbi:MAG TPA: hypothetical protein VFM30_05965 [Steroidobacteraceae bacterium]|nr:hypothetical protein [Steroidobacteraceae bacterium]
MKLSLPALIAAAAAATLSLPAAAHDAPMAKAAEPAVIATKLADARAAQRDLWIGHVFWVRNVVLATFEGDREAATAAEAQVVTNAKAIAASIEPFYGKPASEQLFKLLAGHWGAIKADLDAAHAGDKAGRDAAMAKLLANAEEIAKFLSGANPNLPHDTVKGLLVAHGSHHVQQISEVKARQFDAEAKTWAAMSTHMYVIADALADGTAKQFPDKFR